MVLKILKYPNPILRKKSKKVEEINEEIQKIFKDMIETLKNDQGLGLAAPQVGESKRIIVVHLIRERTPKEKASKEPQIFINPRITEKSKETEIDEEGCLSFPGLFLKIKRAKEVEVEALDIRGNQIKIKAEGLPARIFQHEIDHIDGILLIDRISFCQRLKLKMSLKI